MNSTKSLQLSDLDYDFPESAVAQQPLPERDTARMFILPKDASKDWSHAHVNQLPNWLQAGDLLLLNCTKVRNARLFAHRKSGARIELLFLHRIDEINNEWCCIANRTKRLVAGETLQINQHVHAKIVQRHNETIVLKFSPSNNVEHLLNKFGLPPLPPYIKRQINPQDRDRYQTIY